ncbi:zinc-binding dehydrogenase domain-containing protein [Ditylenchus destructor]|uniref:Enoyl-[acyl-carrier-protein] reductase, mitochondrial n=1 Tax=Ditylenchus destructor TaxID=166010 RepID=A0AAD4R5E1_9BILA|nr:zinc-binding dehydrogenase domain-containing protein [Ditylenchus destructor]
MQIVSRCVSFSRHGNPAEVLSLTRSVVNTANIGEKEVLIRWLAAPINPLDINIIQGTYVNLPELPGIGGTEGVAMIEAVGSQVQNLIKGDMVIPRPILGKSNRGSWRDYDITEAESLQKVDSRVDLVSAATFMVNPPTAYVMLTEYVSLSKGDYVIQNSANSGVGRCAIQIARALGYKTINLIRDRPNVDALKSELKQLGADYVFTEDEFRSQSKKLLANLGHSIQLGLNGVGGKSALMVSATLGFGATFITYGGMSKKPSEFLTSSFVFKNLKAIGVAIGFWMALPENKKSMEKMFRHLEEMIMSDQLKPIPVDKHSIENFDEGIRRTLAGNSKKQLIVMNENRSSSKL